MRLLRQCTILILVVSHIIWGKRILDQIHKKPAEVLPKKILQVDKVLQSSDEYDPYDDNTYQEYVDQYYDENDNNLLDAAKEVARDILREKKNISVVDTISDD